MKYFLQVVADVNRFDAGFKAREDVDSCLKKAGYQPYLLYRDASSWKNTFLAFSRLHKLCLATGKEDILFLQYPYYLFDSRWKSNLFFKKLLSWFPGKIECLIHDIHGLRDGKGLDAALADILVKCSKVIVHTPRMEQMIIRLTGIAKENIRVLYLFDYLTDLDAAPVDLSGKEIIFAGNLDKSLFLRELGLLPESLTFNLYGKKSPNVVESNNCQYKGCFQPNDITAIEGNWGLVWDGDRIDTCHGKLGEYLQFNSSYKMSLYLAACKPLIIWEKSSLKEFVTTKHLGIAVKSLYDIDKTLACLTDKEKELIKANVELCSQKLRAGFFLGRCLA